MLFGFSVPSLLRSFAPEALREWGRLMVAAARALPAEPTSQAVDDLIERGSELGPIAVGDDGFGPVDAHDGLDAPRVALLGEDHLHGGRVGFVLGQGLDLALGTVQDLARDVALACGDLNSHREPRLEDSDYRELSARERIRKLV
jgi:hypothetical protein